MKSILNPPKLWLTLPCYTASKTTVGCPGDKHVQYESQHGHVLGPHGSKETIKCASTVGESTASLLILRPKHVNTERHLVYSFPGSKWVRALAGLHSLDQSHSSTVSICLLYYLDQHHGNNTQTRQIWLKDPTPVFNSSLSWRRDCCLFVRTWSAI